MARELTFEVGGKEYRTSPTKVDRRKLYGWAEIVATDDNGNECTLASTDETGKMIIPKGGTSLGILAPDGKWVERSQLKAVGRNGKPAQPVTSSYNTVISLKDKVTDDEFLEYSITDFYNLTDTPDELTKYVGEDIYTFPYSYLDSYESTPAFVMRSGDNLFMLLGCRNRFEMLCLGDCEKIDDDNDYMELSGDEEPDFSMLF